jgi:acetylglutamate kinase
MKRYDMIIEFLKIIDADRESERFVKLFRKGNPLRFAVIKLGGGVLENSLKLIAMDLAYLSNLDLFPIVIHGGGKQIDRALQEAGLSYVKKDGLRVTTEAQLPIIKNVLDRVNAELVDSVKYYGGRAIGLTESVFIARRHEDESLGYVGMIESIRLDKIAAAIKSKHIPVISSLGNGSNGHYYNINADEAAKAMVLAVKPKKYIILTDEGGIRDREGNIISNVCLEEELEMFEKEEIVSGGMLLKLREAKDLLQRINYRLPIQITSSNHLLKELFTYRGKGTFIKLRTDINEYSGWDSLNKTKIEKLVQNSFGRKLKIGYFDLPVKEVIIDKNYRGMAVVRKVDDMYYLDKFCVSEEAQGQGIGQEIWLHLMNKYSCLFWRARRENPVNNWYFQKADGCLKLGKWILFWINLRQSQIEKAIEYVSVLDETLE